MLLLMFRETVSVYSENQMQHVNTLCGRGFEGGAHSYQVVTQETAVRRMRKTVSTRGTFQVAREIVCPAAV
jgi:hypothetical protein